VSTLATIAAGGILTALGVAGCLIAMARGADQVDQLTPAGYDPAPPADEMPPIVVNRREPW
jgi:hypothetical protein